MNIPLNIDLQQILLHLFNFVILAFGLYFLLYKPVKDFMAKREAHYASMKDEADACLAKAKENEELYRNRLDSADAEIDAMRRQARAEMDELAQRRSNEAEEAARKILSDAQLSAQQEKDKIIAGARDEVSELALSAVRKLMDESLAESYDDFLAAAERSAQ